MINAWVIETVDMGQCMRPFAKPMAISKCISSAMRRKTRWKLNMTWPNDTVSLYVLRKRLFPPLPSVHLGCSAAAPEVCGLQL